MTDTAKILDKIKKLHLKALSCEEIGSEHEAQAFAEMVNRMLNEHRLSLTDIQFEEKRKSEPVDSHYVDWEGHGIRTRAARIQWIEKLASFVARAHTCQIMIVPKSSRVVLVGTQTNREIAEYILVTLVRSAEKIADVEYVKYYYAMRDAYGDPTLARGFRAAFLLGFVDRIAARLAEEKNRMEHNDGSTALVRFNSELADVAAYMRQFGGEQAPSLKKSAIHGAGYRAGAEKADGMNISGNAVKAGQEQGRIA